jgi:hypothetical protein
VSIVPTPRLYRLGMGSDATIGPRHRGAKLPSKLFVRARRLALPIEALGIGSDKPRSRHQRHAARRIRNVHRAADRRRPRSFVRHYGCLSSCPEFAVIQSTASSLLPKPSIRRS